MDITKQNIYNDLDELPIYNFHKCFSGDLKYLYSDRVLRCEVEAKNTWNRLYNKYCELTFNNSTLKYYRLFSEIEYLKNKQIFAPVLLDLLTKTPKENRADIYLELKKWRININSKKELTTELEKAYKNIKGSENKLNRKVDELNNIQNKPTKYITLQSQKAKLHKILSIEINLHLCSVTEWLAYWEEVKNLKQKDGE